MDRESTFFNLVHVMRVSGRMISFTKREHLVIAMGIDMREYMRMVRNLAEEYIITVMGLNIKVNGSGMREVEMEQ